MRENYKNNLVIPKWKSGRGFRSLFIEEPEDSLFPGGPLLPGRDAGDLRRVTVIRRYGLLAHLVCNEREVGVPFLGHGDLLVMLFNRLRPGRMGSGCRERVGRRDIVPWLPVRLGDDHQRRRCSGFPLRDHDRGRSRLVEGLRSRSAERCTAPVTEERVAGGVGGAARRAGRAPGNRFFQKRGTAAGAETRLTVNGRAAAGAADNRDRRDTGAAPVAELCHLVGYDGAAPGTDRVSGFLLFWHRGAAPVAEDRMVVEPRVAALSTGFGHTSLVMKPAAR